MRTDGKRDEHSKGMLFCLFYTKHKKAEKNKYVHDETLNEVASLDNQISACPSNFDTT